SVRQSFGGLTWLRGPSGYGVRDFASFWFLAGSLGLVSLVFWRSVDGGYHGATWTGVDPPASRWISASVDCRRLARNGTWTRARYKRGIDKGKDKVDKVKTRFEARELWRGAININNQRR